MTIVYYVTVKKLSLYRLSIARLWKYACSVIDRLHARLVFVDMHTHGTTLIVLGSTVRHVRVVSVPSRGMFDVIFDRHLLSALFV